MDDHPGLTLMRKFGMAPDAWQAEVLQTQHKQILLNCCRQAGKSTVAAILALAEAMFLKDSKTIIVSPSLRQSSELFRVVTDFYERTRLELHRRRTQGELLFNNGSRIVCLPCKESTIRGFSKVTLIIIDEAARVPDPIFLAVRPMLAVSRGRMICLSTPHGKRGFFHDLWIRSEADWLRIEVPAERIGRIDAATLEQDRQLMGETFFRQEYCCSFEAMSGLVYPELPSCVVTGPAAAFKRRLGGIDFGYRNPFAALWGGIDRDGILWLDHEHYCRQQPLSYHATILPRQVTWYCDPHGANERAELRLAGFTVHKGEAAIAAGIGSVQARIRGGRLRIVAGTCPNLLREASLCCYSKDGTSEQPIDEHDHALDALRYLISKLDQHNLRGRIPAALDLEHERDQPDLWQIV